MCALSAHLPTDRKDVRSPEADKVGNSFKRFTINVTGLFSTTVNGNKYRVVAMDYCSKWAEAYALPNQEAITIAETLVNEFVT